VPVQHLKKEIRVTLTEGDVRAPKTFTLAAQEHKVKEVLSTWQDHSYSGLADRGRWKGGERVFYRVRTAAGDVFEIHMEMPPGRKSRLSKARWYASRRLTSADEASVEEAQSASSAADATPASDAGDDPDTAAS
jgi:hypothetical protein